MAYASWSVVFGEQPSAAKWNILGSNDAWFDSLISQSGGHTVIGTNDTRVTRFVQLTPQVQVASADPANTNWTAVDITANTSANAFAAFLKCRVTSSDTTRSVFVRKTGTAEAQGTPTAVQTTAVATVPAYGSTICELDTSQSFDYSVDSANVTNVTIVVAAYLEYVD